MNDLMIQEAEVVHFKFHKGIYISGVKETPEVTYIWNNKIDDSYWNYASRINSDNIKEQVSKIISFFEKMNKKPVMYITPFSKPNSVRDYIKKLGFKLEFNDAWMFYTKSKPEIVMPANFRIKKVRSLTDMETFVRVFNQCYTGSTPDEPYGEQSPEYGKALLQDFKVTKEGKIVNHYLGLINDEPVGIATLIYDDKYAGIYNVGTIPEKRKKGIGSTLTLHCVSQAHNKVIFLQTEKDTYNERYYEKLGFETKFIGQGFTKM